VGTNNIFFISHDSYSRLYVLCWYLYACKTFDHRIVHGLLKYNSKLVTLFIVVVTLNYFLCNFILMFHNTSQAHFVNITIFFVRILNGITLIYIRWSSILIICSNYWIWQFGCTFCYVNDQIELFYLFTNTWLSRIIYIIMNPLEVFIWGITISMMPSHNKLHQS
jgi:hypothetical protein